MSKPYIIPDCHPITSFHGIFTCAKCHCRYVPGIEGNTVIVYCPNCEAPDAVEPGIAQMEDRDVT